MDRDDLKEIIDLFARSLRELGRAITYDDQNQSQKYKAIQSSNNYLDQIIKIISNDTR